LINIFPLAIWLPSRIPAREHFCIIGFKYDEDHQPMAILKALFNETCIIEKPVTELQTLLIKGKL
jgi:hypothetical protein